MGPPSQLYSVGQKAVACQIDPICEKIEDDHGRLRHTYLEHGACDYYLSAGGRLFGNIDNVELRCWSSRFSTELSHRDTQRQYYGSTIVAKVDDQKHTLRKAMSCAVIAPRITIVPKLS